MTEPVQPRLRTLARAWFDVGTQSAGGGASTLVVITGLVWLVARRPIE